MQSSHINGIYTNLIKKHLDDVGNFFEADRRLFRNFFDKYLTSPFWCGAYFADP